MVCAQQRFHQAGYEWDGRVTAENREIGDGSLVVYDAMCGRFAPGIDRLMPLDEPRWPWRAPHANCLLGGVVFSVEGTPATVVHLRTRTVDLAVMLELEHVRAQPTDAYPVPDLNWSGP